MYETRFIVINFLCFGVGLAVMFAILRTIYIPWLTGDSRRVREMLRRAESDASDLDKKLRAATDRVTVSEQKQQQLEAQLSQRYEDCARWKQEAKESLNAYETVNEAYGKTLEANSEQRRQLADQRGMIEQLQADSAMLQETLDAGQRHLDNWRDAVDGLRTVLEIVVCWDPWENESLSKYVTDRLAELPDKAVAPIILRGVIPAAEAAVEV